ncbi:MAG: inositol monophosphatase family protein [Gammaproteobacteria bacterium]|nr:inositol monophosphatase family protein [Gammaproteobacteria bacterium]
MGCATEIALQYFRTAVPVDVKNDSTPVTLADREIEQRIRELLGRRFPECGVLGEEQGHSEGSGGTWVIDPIDGTKSFLLGNPLFGCLLGFVHNGKVEAGGLAMPALSENWIAGNGRATELNGKRVQTRNCTKLVEAALLTSSPDFFTETERARFEQVSRQVRYRRFGGDCYTYAMLAGGWCDLVVESSLFPFDYLPLVPIVEQAGGVISDWQGNPLGLDSGHQVIAAATQSLHEMAVSILDR